MKVELSKSIKVEIAKRIKKIREEKGMSKYEFAQFIGVSNQYYSTVERGDNCLSVGKIIDLCNSTGVSADYILLGKKNSINDDILKSLSNYNIEDIEEILKIVTSVVKLLQSENNK